MCTFIVRLECIHVMERMIYEWRDKIGCGWVERTMHDRIDSITQDSYSVVILLLYGPCELRIYRQHFVLCTARLRRRREKGK